MFEALRVSKLKGSELLPQDLLIVRKQLEAEYGGTLIAPIPPVIPTSDEMMFVMRGLMDPLSRRNVGRTTT
ncbi:hypothetical protein PHLCEN_2v7155 [Hermanssonia centrifuga]|uniref:Uncharacterized protein n=1 Tax=Hermanssonia centrifuga TaxID=98765 RepID=A0A2R6NXK4_9APHY|nr:hypothetical protein PHLCEN_2v7155 [Hermanssonia centrifuga]